MGHHWKMNSLREKKRKEEKKRDNVGKKRLIETCPKVSMYLERLDSYVYIFIDHPLMRAGQVFFFNEGKERGVV